VTGPAAIELDDVHFGYPDGPEVLRGASLALAAGSRLAIAGPNGAGKSTLLRLAAGLLEPRRGEVRFFGRPIEELPRAELAREVAWVPQEIESAFPFTVGEVALMGRYPHLGPFGFESPRDRAIALGALSEVGAAHLADRLFGSLSGGERRRVAIASALAQEPKVLLLDEPTSGLDLAAQAALALVLERLAARQIAIALVTHDLNLAARIADRVALLAEGRIEALGAPCEVLTQERLARLYGPSVRVTSHEADGLPVALAFAASPRRAPEGGGS